MSDLLKRLKSIKSDIRIGIVGLGAMGKGLLYQSTVTPGIKCAAVAEIKIAKAVDFLDHLNIPYRIVSSPKDLDDAVRAGVLALCEDGALVAGCEQIDVFIESSDSITEAARYSIAAIETGKHLVLMNAEVDLIFGPYLLDLAGKKGVVYTSCDGDQHTVLKRMIDDILLWGFELVMAGNIKGFLDRYSDPKKIVPEADKRNLSYEMCSAMADGTKLNIEMALLANALDLRVLKPGMHGPKAGHVKEALALFDLDGIRKGKRPVVDYLLGAEPDGGVYVIGYCDNKYQRDMMGYYKMGEEPFYLFYRPFHLCHVEAMECVAKAHLEKSSLLKPDFGFRTNVFAFAKKDLKAGEVLDGLGGYTCYGQIDNCSGGPAKQGLPICIAKDVVLKRGIKKDGMISLEDVDFDPLRTDFDLYFRSAAV